MIDNEHLRRPPADDPLISTGLQPGDPIPETKTETAPVSCTPPHPINRSDKPLPAEQRGGSHSVSKLNYIHIRIFKGRLATFLP